NNWNTPVEVTLSANPNPPDVDPNQQPLRVFARRPQVLDSIQGPLEIVGDVDPFADRSLKPAVVLYGENNDDLLGLPSSDESKSIDHMVVFNDDSVVGQDATIDVVASDPLSTHFGGAGMRTDPLILNGVETDRGITYSSLEVAEFLLGTGDDTIEIGGTTAN